MEADERMWKPSVDPRGVIQKGSTSGTAVGAKLGRTKGNKQEAEYTEPERRHGKPGREQGEGSGKRERNRSTEEASCEAETGRAWKGRTDGLSSEMLRWKRTKGKRKSGTDPGGVIQKGSTCGTAVGAKQGRTKGNEQRAE